MENIYNDGAYMFEGFSKDDKPKDIFETIEICEEGNTTWASYSKRPQFGRYLTLEEELIELKKKYINTKNEVLVQHMIDSLIIFNHNRKNVGEVYPEMKPFIYLEDEVTLTS